MQQQIKCSREQYTTEKKLKIINQLEISGESIQQYGERNQISPSMLCRWLKAKSQLEAREKKSVRTGSGRKPYSSQLEQQVYEEMMREIANGSPINYAWIKNCAKSKCEKLGISLQSLTLSDGWIFNFLKGQNLKFRSSNKQKAKDNGINLLEI